MKSLEIAANENQFDKDKIFVIYSKISFDLNSLIIIRNSLNSIGLENLSKVITQEIMTSKIVNL